MTSVGAREGSCTQSFWEATDHHDQDSRRKLPRPVCRCYEQFISPRNHHFLGAHVGLRRPDEVEFSHWLVSLSLACYRCSAMGSWAEPKASFFPRIRRGC